MIQVINRAFDILELISKDKEKIFSLTEIADELGLNHATCANIIKTMVLRNYIEQVGYKKGYRIGFMAFRMSGDHSYEKELINASKEEMEALTSALNETSLLGILKKDLRISLFQMFCNNYLSVRSKEEKPAYSSASGRLLIAMKSDSEVEAFITKYKLPERSVWEKASTREGFYKEIQEIRRNGYARQRSVAHIVGYAVPIYRKHEVIASLSIFLPESRDNEKIAKKIIAALKKSAVNIREKLE